MAKKLLYDEEPFTKDGKRRLTKTLASRPARKLSKTNFW
jgi:hypothetical protein